MAKRKKKQKRIRAVEDDDDRPARNANKNANKARKKQTNFANDLADTSRTSAKRLRYEANRIQKGKPLQKGKQLQKGKGRPMKGKPKGKTFGKPQTPKQGPRRKK